MVRSSLIELSCAICAIRLMQTASFSYRLTTKAARAFERRYLNSVDAFIFASAATKIEVESLIQTDKPSIIAYPGCDRLHAEITESEILARAARPGPLQLIYVGSLIARKGLAYLLQA